MPRPPMPPMTLAVGGIFLLAILLGAELARPFRGASVAYDSQVAVLHWDRIASGRLLETFITTTPKPLMTVVFGPLHALTHDWRPLAWATILVFAASVTGASVLARRAGGWPAGAFVGLGLMGTPAVLFDVGLTLATPWALAGWTAAGLLATGERPRYAVAGLALLLASLARLETLVLVGVVGLVLLLTRAVGRPSDRRMWLVPAVALGAIPVMCVHDWLLARDPLMWLTIAAQYSEVTDLEVLTPVGVARFLAGRYAEMGALTLLAIVGFARLIQRLDQRTVRVVLVGLIGLGPGVAALLELLAIRGIFVSERYAAPIDIAVLFAAAIGFTGLSIDVGAWTRSRVTHLLPRLGADERFAAALLAAVVAGILIWPSGLLDSELRGQVHNSLAAAADMEVATPILAREIAADPEAARSIGIAVPNTVAPRMAVDLAVPITSVARTNTLAPTDLEAGLLIFHDRRAERTPDTASFLEIDGPTAIGPFRLELVAADISRGWWIVRVR